VCGTLSCQSLSAIFVHFKVLFLFFFLLFLHFACYTCFMCIQYIHGLSQPRLSTTDHALSTVAYTTTLDRQQVSASQIFCVGVRLVLYCSLFIPLPLMIKPLAGPHRKGHFPLLHHLDHPGDIVPLSHRPTTTSSGRCLQSLLSNIWCTVARLAVIA
jgi:hypothetical protein